MEHTSRSSRFRQAVKAGVTRLVLLVASLGRELRLSWENRHHDLRLLREEDREAWVAIPGKLERTRVGRAIDIVAPVPHEVWSHTRRLGGYKPLFANDLPSDHRVLKIDLPSLRAGDDPELFVESIKPWLEEATLGYLHKGSLVLARGSGGWLSFWTDQGMEITVSAVLGKRLANLTRVYAATKSYAWDAVRLCLFGSDADKRLYDGFAIIRRSLYEDILGDCDLSYEAVERARRSPACNFRGLVPAGTPGAPRGGELKCNIWVVDDKVLDALGYQDFDIVSHRCNLKPELHGWTGWSLGLEPQPPTKEVRTDVQSMLSVQGLFPLEEVKQWAQRHVYKIVDSIVSGKLLDTFDVLAGLRTEEEEAEVSVLTTLLTQTRWQALDFVASGHDFQHSPELTNRLFQAHTSALTNRRKGKVSIPVPCAWHMQVLPAACAEMLGWSGIVEPGQIRITESFAVVRNDWWLLDSTYLSHGGWDLDDFSNLFFRLIDGRKSVILMRSPNDMGEYSVLDYVDGDPCPHNGEHVWNETRDGFIWKELAWPQVAAKKLTPRLGDAVEQGLVTVTGLPEETGSCAFPEEYSKKYLLNEIRRALTGTNPGCWVNARMLLNSCTGKLPSELPAFMEQVIDACTKGGNVQQLLKIRQMSRDLVNAIVATGAPIDETFWATRGFVADTEPNLVKGWLTWLLDEIDNMVSKARSWIASWAQQIHQVPLALCHFEIDGVDDKSDLLDILYGMRQRQAIIIAKGKQEAGYDVNQAMAALYEDVKAEVGDGRLAEFAYLVHRYPTKKTQEIKDAVLISASWFEDYLAILGEI